MNPLKAEGFPWLAAKQEVRTSKHERDSTHRCWLEEGKSHVLRNFKEVRAAPCQQPGREWDLSPTTTGTKSCQQLKCRFRSRFFLRSSRPESDGQHLDFGLVRLYAENPAELTQTSDLRKCELISECCFKQLICGNMLCSHRKLIQSTQLNSTILPILKSYFLKWLRKQNAFQYE